MYSALLHTRRPRTTTLLFALGFIWATLLIVSACASLSVKDQTSRSIQSIHASVKTLDQMEIAVCQPAPPPKSNTCTANPRLLSDADHQRLSQWFVQAYTALETSEKLVAAWDPSTPKPTNLPSARIYIEQIQSLLKALPNVDPKITDMLTLAADILDMITKAGA